MGVVERLRSMFVTGRGVEPSTGGAVPRVLARATYEAGSVVPRTSDWQPPDPSANVATATAATIRQRCRDAMRNDSWARAIVETFVDDVVGWGIKPLSRAPDETFRQALQRRWEDWSAVADADNVLDFAGLEALAVRQVVVDGEVFVRLRRRKPEDHLPVPLQIQLLPAEVCPAEHTVPVSQGGNRIKQGIEYDAIGRRVAYWFRESVPGEDDVVSSSARLHRVPATEVLHLFEPLRPGQRRGVSMLAPALVRLHELDKFADATLLRLQLSTMVVATLKSTLGADATFDPITGEKISETTPEGRPVLRLAPGTFQQLGLGEELSFNNPPAPAYTYSEFVKNELRAAGAALGVPFEAFSHEWTGQNDRIARVTLNQYRRRVHRFLWSIVVPQFLRPAWNAWYQLAVLQSNMSTTGITADSDRVTFAPHAHAYVHPVQDVQSYREAIRSGLTSRAAAVAETGEDAEVIDAQIASDNARADKLGLKLDSDGRIQKGGAS